jgi:hypothetical protein
MEDMTRNIFAGHPRSIVGAMRVVDIHRNRDALAEEILQAITVRDEQARTHGGLAADRAL